MRYLHVPSNDEAAVVVLSESEAVQRYLIIASFGDKHIQNPIVMGSD
jgi:hypothetical protein